VTIVGPKDQPLTGDLARAALAYPAPYKRVDRWDRRDGPLPNNDIEFPAEPAIAAYACTQNICSLPVTEPARLPAALDRLAGLGKPHP
jgi:hypothetical protein